VRNGPLKVETRVQIPLGLPARTLSPARTPWIVGLLAMDVLGCGPVAGVGGVAADRATPTGPALSPTPPSPPPGASGVVVSR